MREKKERRTKITTTCMENWKKEKPTERCSLVVTFHWNLHSYGKARDLPVARELPHFLRNSQRSQLGLMVEENLLLALQMDEPFSPLSLMLDMIPLLAASLDPLLVMCVPDAMKLPHCRFSALKKNKDQFSFVKHSVIWKGQGSFQPSAIQYGLHTSKGDKSAPRLKVISMRNLFGSSRGTCSFKSTNTLHSA